MPYRPPVRDQMFVLRDVLELEPRQRAICHAILDALNDRGQSPLAGAVFKAEPEVVAALLEHGADPDAGTPSARATAQIFGQEGLLER